MLVEKEEFIRRFMEKFNHTANQRLQEVIPPKGYLMENIEAANGVIRELVKRK